MTDLTERFQPADLLEVDDVWPDVQERITGTTTGIAPVRRLPTNAHESRGSNSWRRAFTAAAALLIFAASVAWIWAFRVPEGRQPASGNHAGLFDNVHGWLSYASDGSIYAIDPQGGSGGDRGPTLLLRPASDGVVPLSWSADGSTLLFASITRDGSVSRDPSSIDLFLLDNAGTQTLVAEGIDGLGGSLSPDGSVVYEELVSSDPGVSRIVRLNPNTGQRSIVSLSHSGVDWTPTASPDGASIAMFHVDNGAVSLDVMRSDGGSRRTIVDAESLPSVSDVSGISWSPEGTRLAFGLYTRDKVTQVWVVNTDGSGLARISENAAFPSWSPDGASISFSRLTGSMATMDPDGGSVHERLTFAEGVDETWSGRAGPWNPVPSGG